MPWARFDDRFDQDRDLAYLTEGAVALHLCATTWCSRNLTDGNITKEEVKHLFGYSPSAVKALTSKCAPGNKPWWETTSTGYRIRSYCDYNPTAEQVQAAIQQRSEAGKRNAGRRWGEGRKPRNGGKFPNESLNEPINEPFNESLNEPLNEPICQTPEKSNESLNAPNAPVSHIPGIKQVATQELGMPNSNLGVEGLEDAGSPNASGGLEISEGNGRAGGPVKLGDLARQIVGGNEPPERPKRRAAPRPAEDFDPNVPDEETERLRRDQIERLKAASQPGAA